ncbi:MAG: helix-turn-helix domain-containing protein [Isosphaeraceae bacterium]|nr:helix-turn-helix domain-containing protein [Isosphaeraceae bacterium]
MTLPRVELLCRVGAAFAQARRRAGLTQREAARQLGVSVDAVRSWEQGRRFPSSAYRRAAITWGGDPEALLGDIECCPTCGRGFA